MFSIIMPVYNGAKFINGAIQSILEQTYQDWELIIVNDGSTDETPKILEKYADNKKIQILTQENGGVSVARNNGVAKAKGSHIALLDADDLWHKNHLEVLNNMIEKYPSAGLYGTFAVTELANGKLLTECSYFKGREETVFLEDFFAEYHKDKSVKLFAASTTCISKEAFAKAGGFPVGCRIGEDLELSLRVAAYFPVALTGTITGTYKKVNSTATKDNSFDPDWKFFDTVTELYEDETIPSAKKENIKKVMQWFTMRRCRHYIINGQKKKAWKQFFHIGSDSNLVKDKLITFLLLLLPVFLVRKIFRVRWSGRA